MTKVKGTDPDAINLVDATDDKNYRTNKMTGSMESLDDSSSGGGGIELKIPPKRPSGAVKLMNKKRGGSGGGGGGGLGSSLESEGDSRSISSGNLNFTKMDANKIKLLGFPVRMLLEEFIQRYKILVFSPMADIEATREHCQLIARKADLKEYEITDNKIFLSYADAAKLRQIRKDVERKVIRTQALVRGYLVRQRSKSEFDKDGLFSVRPLGHSTMVKQPAENPAAKNKTQHQHQQHHHNNNNHQNNNNPSPRAPSASSSASSSAGTDITTTSTPEAPDVKISTSRDDIASKKFDEETKSNTIYNEQLRHALETLDPKILSANQGYDNPYAPLGQYKNGVASDLDDVSKGMTSGLTSRNSEVMRTTGSSDDEARNDHFRRKKRVQRRNSLKSNTTVSESTAVTNMTNLSTPNSATEDPNAVAWDVFRSISRRGETFYESTTNKFEVAAKTVKVVAYILIFLAVLFTAIASKASLLLMTQAIGNADLGSENRDRWVYLLICAVCLPYLVTFGQCLVKVIFKTMAGPSILNIIWVLLVETIHSLGLCLFLFRVLPCLDTARCLLLMNALCSVPAVLRLFATNRSDEPKRKVATVLLDLLALLMQLSAFVIVLASMKSECVTGSRGNTDAEEVVENKGSAWQNTYSLSDMSWEIPLSLLLISVRWWENFCDKDFRLGCITVPVKMYKDTLYRCRTKCYLIGSLWKIGVTFGFAFLLVPNLPLISKTFEDIVNTPSQQVVYNVRQGPPGSKDILFNLYRNGVPNVTLGPLEIDSARGPVFPNQYNPSVNNNNGRRDNNQIVIATSQPDISETLFMGIETKNCTNVTTVDQKTVTVCTITYVYRWRQWQTYLPLIIQIVSSWLCYYFAKLACKLCMQRVSFAIPLSLATPVTVAIIISICYIDKSKLVLMGNFLEWTCTEGGSDKKWLIWHLGLGFGLWWASQLWITRYIWTPKAPRLAFTERLFVLPQYCGALIEQSILLNRRRNDRERVLKETALNDDVSMDSSSTDLAMRRQREQVVPKIFVCATMWHETEREMLNLLMSIFRLDIDQSARRNAQDYFNVQDPDYYEFEANIFVDDAMDYNMEGEWMPNMFVKQLIAVIDEAASLVHESEITLMAPVKIPTPYGGRLVWTLPGGNLLIAHIKDKNKIRHKKRWSQVMYMYYLLGYRLLGQQDEPFNTSTMEKDEKWKSTSSHFVKGNLFKYIPERVLMQAENTYILTLDGDVDFKAHAVQLLVDRMKKNKKVGAACGRIHPIGSGPLSWYQIFEYAIGHWLQKAAEHMLGCVLCSPGCFSLFRGSALMDDNVMRTYATRSSEARHYMQYDQGEDRWLSTLLLQQGYKMEYCAAADAMTHCPESFKEFFNQRRRWIPSTLANIMDLLQSFRTTVRINDNISYLYMIYQGLLMLSTVLGPATILLMMAGALNPVLNISLWQSYLLSVGPMAVFLVLCFCTKQETQLYVAAVLSAVYSLGMMTVIVGTAVQIAEDSLLSPNALFLIMLAAIFLLSAAFHPQEFLCVIAGALYFLALPSGYVLLIIYAMCNLHVVSWGTREQSSQERKAQLRQRLSPKNSGGFSAWIHRQEEESVCCGKFLRSLRHICGSDGRDINTEILRQVIEKLDKVEAGMRTVQTGGSSSFQHNRKRSSSRSRHSKKSNKSTIKDIEEEAVNGDASSSTSSSFSDDDLMLEEDRDELINPRWLEDPVIRAGEVQYLPMREIEFWQRCIAKYLHPINSDKTVEAKMAVDLKSLRNNVAFAFFMMNAFWMVIIFMLQRVKDKISITIPRYEGGDLKIEPLGLIFMSIFAVIVLLQFIAMLRHRYGTLLHILASTELRVNKKKFNQKQAIRDIVEYAMKMQKLTGFDEDLTDQDYDGMSSSESRPTSMQPENMYASSVNYLSPRSMGVEDGNGPIQQGNDLPYSLMLDNPAYEDTEGKPHGSAEHSKSAAGRQDSKEGSGNGPSKKGKTKLGRSKSTMVDKNNTLRKQFERRYKRLLKNHSDERSGEPGFDPFVSRSLRESRRSAKSKRESVEDVVARFNNFNK